MRLADKLRETSKDDFEETKKVLVDFLTKKFANGCKDVDVVCSGSSGAYCYELGHISGWHATISEKDEIRVKQFLLDEGFNVRYGTYGIRRALVVSLY